MRFVPAEELFHSADNREGMEYSASGHGARLIVNSAMAAEAAAIATLARAGGKSGLADEYAAKAAALTTSLKTKLWNEALTFFVTRHDDGDLADVLARRSGIGRMSAQAIGGAVGWNPLCIIIPCHRVVGSGNRLVGYGGGLHNKSALLALEQKH